MTAVRSTCLGLGLPLESLSHPTTAGTTSSSTEEVKMAIEMVMVMVLMIVHLGNASVSTSILTTKDSIPGRVVVALLERRHTTVTSRSFIDETGDGNRDRSIAAHRDLSGR